MTAALPPRLLVVDDVEDNRTILRRRFTRLGYQVMEAEEGEKAIAMAAQYPFDVVLLDIMMPGIDGLEVLRRLRERYSESQLPVIMVTAKAASEDVVEALLIGANDYITKPVDMEVAAARVEMQLRRKRADDLAQGELASLEKVVASLVDAVAQAQNRAAALDRDGDQHQPLAGVLGAARVLTRLCDTPELSAPVTAVASAQAALGALINDVVRPGAGERRQAAEDIHALWADDDASHYSARRELFAHSAATFHVSEVMTGRDAVAAVRDGRFDLVMMNVDMADGLASVRDIRKAEAANKTRRLPIVAISADAKSRAKAVKAGADLHLVTPVTRGNVLAALAAALRRESEDMTNAA